MSVSAVALGPRLPWSQDESAERRYANILLAVLLSFLVLSLLLPLLPLFHLPPQQQEQKLPPRIAQLVIKARKPPPPPPPVKKKTPKPKPKPKPQAKPKPKPQPTPKPRPTRKVKPRTNTANAAVAGLADELKDLKENSAANSLSSQRNLNRGAKAGHTQRKLITSDLGQGSTGIRSESGTPGALGGGTELAGRSLVKVKGPPGDGAVGGSSGVSGTGGTAQRSIQSIQVVFDRNKGSLFSIYQRALKNNPQMRGTLVLRLVIQPSGKVSQASVISSELDDKTLVDKIVARVRQMNFGAKDVPVWRGPYPIRFFPS